MPQDLGMVSCDEAAGEQLGDSPGSRSLNFVISKMEIRGPTPPCVVVERINETIEEAHREGTHPWRGIIMVFIIPNPPSVIVTMWCGFHLSPGLQILWRESQ